MNTLPFPNRLTLSDGFFLFEKAGYPGEGIRYIAVMRIFGCIAQARLSFRYR